MPFLRGLTLRICFCLMFMNILSTYVWADNLYLPQKTVQDLYQTYLHAQDAKACDSIIQASFTKELNALYLQQIKKDSAQHEVGCINDFDVLTGAQERPLSFKRIRSLKQGQKVEVILRFDFGAHYHTQLGLLMRFEQGRWLIDDLRYLDIKQSLREMIAACPSS